MRRSDGLGVGRVDFGGERVEQVVFVGQDVGLSIEDRRKVAAGDVLEKRECFVANPIAQMGGIGVAGIVDGHQVEAAT